MPYQIQISNTLQNAFLSAVPYLCMWIFSLLGSQWADFMRTKGYWTTTNTRKIMCILGRKQILI